MVNKRKLEIIIQSSVVVLKKEKETCKRMIIISFHWFQGQAKLSNIIDICHTNQI